MSTLADLHREILGCCACELAKHRTRVVPGEGDENARIVLIGEAPGLHEDRQGRPFVGAAGKFLEELLASIGLKRNRVYICNVLKCRPPGNRDPMPEEIVSCRKWLDSQLEIIKPKIVVTLGRHSMARFFPGVTISKVHGRERQENGVIYFPMYHPAAALHQQSLRRTIEMDMQRIRTLLDMTEDITAVPKTGEEPKQLSMF